MKKILLSSMLCLASHQSFALNILLSNDDGLTSNIKALATALKNAGHSVVVSVPCTGQSGRSGGIVMYSTDKINALNDSQITTNKGCLNGAAVIGDPAVGAFTKSGYSDYYYVHGTPVMAVMYGIDVVAQNKWGKAPDLVLSGPNEGQNLGTLNLFSGTVGIIQYAGSRGLAAIALSAGSDTADNTTLANPSSTIIADQTVKLINELQTKAGSGKLLPANTVLNVNFPNDVSSSTAFAFSKLGTYNQYALKFKNSTTAPYGYTGSVTTTAPTASQAQDETAVILNGKISVTAMQIAYEARPAGQEWLKLRLRNLFAK